MPSKYSALDIEIPSDLQGQFKKVKKLANLVTSCFMCLFSILNILLLLIILTSHSLMNETDFTELLPIANFISANLNAAPVTTIVLANNMTCPDSYEFQALTTWPGTVQGCYCPKTGDLYAGQCSEADQDQCQAVDPISSQGLSLWNNQAFCVLRASDYTTKAYDENCPTGYQACSKFCVNENVSCPITDVEIKSPSDINGQEYIQLDDTRVLVISRDPNEDALYEIGASFYDQPCLQSNRLPEKLDGSLYPLLNVPSSGCGVYGVDKASTLVEGLNTTVFFEQNNFTAVENLPLFSQSESNSEAYLVSRSRLHLADSDQCQELGTQHLTMLVDLLGSFKKWVIGATIFPMIVIAVYIMYLIFLLFDEGLKKFYKKAAKKWASWILFTLCLATVIFYDSYLSAENVKIVDQQQYYALLGASDCFSNTSISLVLAAFALAIPLGSVVVTNYAHIMFWSSVVFYAIAAIAMIAKAVYKKMND